MQGDVCRPDTSTRTAVLQRTNDLRFKCMSLGQHNSFRHATLPCVANMDCRALAHQVSTPVETGFMVSDNAFQLAILISDVFVVVPFCDLSLRFEQITDINQ